ncbi:glycoside hydrolase family 38 C-terminal domain-containing protein [Microcoleus sp. ARI1-B5]|uniref:alpha-mannosidase n=1 Tax=unclassified Microcoleus TaxID=2642155 RepID=UPI002FD667EE
MNASVPPASNNISEVVEKLRRLSQVEVQSGWRYCDCDSAAAGSVGISNGPVAELNGKGHIAWPSGKQVVYLGQKFVIPDNLHGYPVLGLRLLLGLTWWAEDAAIFVNGELVGRGDLFDCADRVLLSASANPGDEFLVILRLVSPGHDNGALVRSICLYEAADSTCFDPGFVAAELEILQNSLTLNLENKNSQYLPTEIIASPPWFVKGEMLQSEIDLALGLIDWSAVCDRQKFDRSLSVLRHNLLGCLRAFSGELDDLTAEGAEGTEGERGRVSQVGENQNSTSIYIGENRNSTSFVADLNDLTAEGAEDTEGGRREKLSQVGENQNSTSIYIGETGDTAFLNQVRHSPANHQLPITNYQLPITNYQSRPDSLETYHTSIYTGKIYLVGHAHLDLAWLWPVPETWKAAERTFESVLKLQSEFPDLIFCHSTPALYAWMEEHRPDLFAAIQKQVAVGRWEVVGGMWVEPDLNLISAESMVRQVFYGQRYAKEKFGELMRVAWLPDTFGFGWQLPQILRQGGVDYFVTQKLCWNDSTQFPHGAFWWEGLDGTKIFSMMSGAIGESVESVKMASHAFDWQVKTGLQDALWLPGVGDHGGGPTRDMLEVAKRWKLSPFFPNLQFAKAVDYLSLIESQFLPEVAKSESQSDVSQPSPENLPLPKTVETLTDVASGNLLENSATLRETETQQPPSRENLPLPKTVENLLDVAPENLLENSTALRETRTSTAETPASLESGKVVENLLDVAPGNLLENSATLPESRMKSPENPESLKFRKTAENLSALDSNFSATMSESEPEYLDFSTEIHNEKSQLKNSPPLPLSPSPTLPIWQDELYLEFHRGCYTTRADQKRQNRRCEELLYQAELLSSIATICTGAVYPKSELESAWKQVLFNQFHDILPGSAIAQVYTDANLAFAEVDRACRQILLQSLDAIAAQISLPKPPQPDAQPIFVFNTLNWSRSEVVALPLRDSAWQICDLSGQRLTKQIVKGDRLQPQSEFTLLFSADRVPAIGYRLFWLCRDAQTVERASASPATEKQTDLSKLTYGIAQKNTPCQETHFAAQEIVLENELILAKIDAKTGNLSSIWDKANNREVLNAAGGNQLQAFQDSGQYWDAWNIDPNYQKHPLPAPILKEIYWVERGEVRQILRAVLQIGKSEFRQDYTVEIDSPLLKIKTVVDWQETHVLVKTAFGLNVEADFATCEIPGGAIARTTKPQTPAEKAKWEVPILRWTDISNDGFGVSLLNDCKYGCDIQPNQIRLTLLRGSTWPDEAADKGVSEFTCAVYPHAGNWQDAGTVRQGYELNLPLLVKVLPKFEENRNQTLPAVGKFLDLSAENLVLVAFKQSEDDANLWILRCCESEGKQAVLELDSDLGLEILESVDLLERSANLSEKLPQGRGFKIERWKIASFAVLRNRVGVACA